jgi:hypothetical protein
MYDEETLRTINGQQPVHEALLLCGIMGKNMYLVYQELTTQPIAIWPVKS